MIPQRLNTHRKLHVFTDKPNCNTLFGSSALTPFCCHSVKSGFPHFIFTLLHIISPKPSSSSMSGTRTTLPRRCFVLRNSQADCRIKLSFPLTPGQLVLGPAHYNIRLDTYTPQFLRTMLGRFAQFPDLSKYGTKWLHG